MSTNTYIHGSDKKELARLNKLNYLTNSSFINYLNIEAGFTICEVGCGTGDLLFDIATLYPSALITGIEISKEHYETASERTKDLSNVHLIHIDYLDNTLEDNCFDLVYCRYVLEHVSDPVKTVRDMLRISKHGGHVVSQENDLKNITYYPPIPGHENVLNSFCELQLKTGGDPFIGRKLFDIFKTLAASKIELDIEPEIYSESDPERYKLWINNSMEILLGAKENLKKFNLLNEEDFNKTIEEMERRIEHPNGISLFYWNRIKATK